MVVCRTCKQQSRQPNVAAPPCEGEASLDACRHVGHVFEGGAWVVKCLKCEKTFAIQNSKSKYSSHKCSGKAFNSDASVESAETSEVPSALGHAPPVSPTEFAGETTRAQDLDQILELILDVDTPMGTHLGEGISRLASPVSKRPRVPGGSSPLGDDTNQAELREKVSEHSSRIAALETRVRELDNIFGNDVAEWMEMHDSAELIEAGDVVEAMNGKISRNLTGRGPLFVVRPGSGPSPGLKFSYTQPVCMPCIYV